MKVSMSPKYSNGSAEVGNSENTALPTEELLQNAGQDKYVSASIPAESTETTETDDFAEIMAFYGAGSGNSKDNFIQANPPTVTEIISDPNLKIEMTEKMGFYDLMEKNYKDLKQRYYDSIKNLETAKEKDPANSQIYQQIIKQRERAMRKCDEEIANIEPLRATLKNVYEQELKNLADYGKEYYKWHMAYKQHTDYTYVNADGETISEKATLANKPNAMDEKWGLALDGDAAIGDPKTSKLAIFERTAEMPDGSFETIYDVGHIDENKPVSFDAMGNYVGIASKTDENYNWTISHSNLKLKDVDPKETGADVTLELSSENIMVSGNGTLNAPIDISIPEYVKMGEKREPFPVVEKNGEIVQEKGGENFTLERVIDVKVRNATSLSTDKAGDNDYVIELYGDKGLLMSIRITGTENIAASQRALSLNAGYEGDEYSRSSGINIDASTMKSKAEYDFSQVQSKIQMEYGISNLGDVYGKAVGELTEGPFGLMIYGFHNVCGSLDAKNNLVLLEDALEEEFKTFDRYDSDTVHNPLITNALTSKGGFNAVFHKSGNLYADNFGLVYGGSDDDEIYINAPTRVGKEWASVYVNLKNNNGHVEIYNGKDDPGGKNYGIADDAFIVDTPDVLFGNPYDPDINNVEQYSDIYGEPIDPLKPELDEEQLENMDIAVHDDIKKRTKEHIAAQLQALKDQPLEETDLDPFDFTGAKPKFGGEFAVTTEEMDNFFGGWNAINGGFGFGGDDTLPGFDGAGKEITGL